MRRLQYELYVVFWHYFTYSECLVVATQTIGLCLVHTTRCDARSQFLSRRIGQCELDTCITVPFVNIWCRPKDIHVQAYTGTVDTTVMSIFL